MVIGCSGVGKSTLARLLGQVLVLPVTHLDSLYYRPGWRDGDAVAFRSEVLKVVAGDQWIIDGNFMNHEADARLQRAQLVLWLDQPLHLRLFRAAWRGIVGRPRPDLPPGCRDSLDLGMFADILAFDIRTAPAIKAALNRCGRDRLVRLRGDQAIKDWLKTIQHACESSA
jgi:hypothetical protein